MLIFYRQAVGLNGVIEMRIVKKAEDRKNEILNAADELFGQKGFDGTSTNDILEKVGIARGTLYHHFPSKEDIMDGLIARYQMRLIETAQAIASDKSVPVLARIIQVVMSLNLEGESSEEVMEHIHQPQNALMHQKIQQVIIAHLPPILTTLIEEGIEQQLFNTPVPYECMEMVVIYATTVFDGDMVLLNEQERLSRMIAFIENVERMLGAKSGSLMGTLQMFGVEAD